MKRDILLNIKRQFMKASYTLAGNVTIKEEKCFQTWCKHVFKYWINMSSNSRGIVKESQVELSVHEL